MSIYQEALTKPNIFIENVTSARRVNIADIGRIFVRAGQGKASLIMQLLQGSQGVSDRVPSVWDEDANRYKNLSPSTIVLNKANTKGLHESEYENSYSLAADTDHIIDGVTVKKPKDLQTREEVVDFLRRTIGGDIPHNGVARTAIAALRTDNSGLITRSQNSFQFTPFSDAELFFYVYGLVSDKPNLSEREEMLKHFQERFDLTEQEVVWLSSGLTLEELITTNGGIRWLHPLFISHLTKIDSVSVNDPTFNQKLKELFSTLMSVPQEIVDLLCMSSTPMNSLAFPQTENASLYSDGRVAEIVGLNGNKVCLRRALLTDATDISRLTTDNFMHAPNYQQLTQEQRVAYIYANNLSGIEHLLGKGVVDSLVARDTESGVLLGYCIGRQDYPDDNCFHLRRMHVLHSIQRQTGLGSTLLERAEERALEKGCSVVDLQASGSSHSWFERRGYETISQKVDGNGVFGVIENKPSYFLMRKQL